jgi:hypothetical protein
MAVVKRFATISNCGRYRYALRRNLGGRPCRTACFIMLNPSTADAEKDDPTIRKCMGFARRWGCADLVVVNLFAFRATRPQDLRAAADPVGRANRRHVRSAVDRAQGGLVVCAWGTYGAWWDQDLIVRAWIREVGAEPVCLGRTKGGHPRHPLYVPYTAELIPYA